MEFIDKVVPKQGETPIQTATFDYVSNQGNNARNEIVQPRGFGALLL